MFSGAAVIPIGHSQITLTTGTVSTLTIPSLNGVLSGGCIFNAETQNLRFRDDGIAPTSSTGYLLKATDPPLEYRGNLKNLQFIAATSGAILNVAFYKVVNG